MKNKKRNENADCPTHQKPFVLFCNEPNCHVSVCAKCITERHNNHTFIPIESKAEQGKKILQISSKSAKQMCKKYANHCGQIDLAIRRVHNISKESIDVVNEYKMRVQATAEYFADQLSEEITKNMAVEITRLNKEKEKISISEWKMNSLVQSWNAITSPQEILSEASVAVKKILEISDQIKDSPLSEVSIPNFLPTRMADRLENPVGSIFMGKMPVILPLSISEYGKLEFPAESTPRQEMSPIRELNLQMSWEIKGGRGRNMDPPWDYLHTNESSIGIRQICAVGDKIVVVKQNGEESSLIAFNINGDIVCSTREGHSSLRCLWGVTDMAEAIPRNSNEAFLITSHREKNELAIWQFDEQQIYRCDNLVGFAPDIEGGCPDWICSAGKGSVYLVSGKSPEQVVWKLGVVASNPENAGNRRAHISLEFSESRKIGINDVRGLACIKAPNKEDVLVFSSADLKGGALVAKTASSLQTLWRVDNSEHDRMWVKSMCVDPKRGLLYTLHDRRINDETCNVILVYDAENVRFSQVLAKPTGCRGLGAVEIGRITFCQSEDRLVVKVRKEAEEEFLFDYDTIINIQELKYTREP